MKNVCGGGVQKGTRKVLIDNKKKFADLYYKNVKKHCYINKFTLLDAEKKMDELINYLECENAILYYIQYGNKVVAFIWLHPYVYKKQSRFYMHAISVDEKFRGQGLGKKLYYYIFREILPEVTVYTHVDAVNIPSICLHTKVGFREETCQYVKRIKS